MSFVFWPKKCKEVNIFFCDFCFQNAISKLILNKPKYFESKEVLINLKFKLKTSIAISMHKTI